MLLIKSLEYIVVDGDTHTVECLESVGHRVKHETVVGRLYTYPNRADVVIGMTKEVDKILGGPLSVADDLVKYNQDQYGRICALREQLKAVQQLNNNQCASLSKVFNASWWTRLKFLFGKEVAEWLV